MAGVGIFLLSNVFSAILPALNSEDRDFYEVLGLENHRGRIKIEDIRKAYKKKSLQLHPDKIAQRGGDAVAARAEYELVQEAYGILVDPKLRKRYHALKRSPTRYRFVMNGSMTNPTALHENLRDSSFCDKSRIVILVFMFLVLLLLQPTLIAIKVNHMLEDNGGALEDVSWVILFIPLWILYGQYIIILTGVTVFVLYIQPNEESDITETKEAMILSLLENICYYVGLVFLVFKWDGQFDEPYSIVFIPIYAAYLLEWFRQILSMRRITSDINKMVSEIYFKDEILQGASIENLSEEDRQKLQKDYIVVQVPPEMELLFTHDEEELDPQLKEMHRVMASKEFVSATDNYSRIRYSLFDYTVFHTAFWVLVVLKLDDINDLGNMSWWVTFVPIWTSLGIQLFYSCFLTCCSVSTVSIAADENQSEVDNNNDNDDGNNNNGNASNESGQSENKTAVSPESQNGNKSDETAKDDNINNQSKEKPKEKSKIINPVSQDNDAGTSTTADSKPPAPGLHQQNTSYQQNNNNGTKEEKTQNDSKKDSTDEDDDDGSFKFDDENFNAWQSAYAESEYGDMEKRTRAQALCCSACCQIILLCIFVTKLNAATDGDASNIGFNALWFLFPVFLMSCCIVCCCACLIYGAGSIDNLEELMKQQQQQEDADNQGDSEVVPPPPVTQGFEVIPGDSDKAQSTSTSTPVIVESKTSAQAVQPSSVSQASVEPSNEATNSSMNASPPGPTDDVETGAANSMEDLD